MATKAETALLEALHARFAANMHRHEGISWEDVRERLAANPGALRALRAMEDSGGEPDVIARDADSGELTFCDCAPESPTGRRSACYDRAALDARKANKPGHNAVELAAELGITMLTEAQYHALQQLDEFDRKTSSWVSTPDDIRALGGALFCDRRFGRVFTYHNGAESYYAARGFRGMLRV
jgi:hypothetical protein